VNPTNYLELLKLAAPETIVVLTALIVLAADLITMRDLELRFRLVICALISCAGCAAAIAWMLVLPEHADVHGMLVIDPLTQLVKIGVLVMAILAPGLAVARATRAVVLGLVDDEFDRWFRPW